MEEHQNASPSLTYIFVVLIGRVVDKLAGEAKVDKNGRSVGGEDEVSQGYVLVDDVVGVQMFNGAGHLCSETDDCGRRELVRGDVLLQRSAGVERHQQCHCRAFVARVIDLCKRIVASDSSGIRFPRMDGNSGPLLFLVHTDWLYVF